MGVHRVLVSLLDFKSSVAGHKLAGWVRFPHAPANISFNIKERSQKIDPLNRHHTATNQ